MKTAFQMDHIAGLDIAGDSTFRLALEAQSRGHELFHYTPDDLWYDDGAVWARGNWMTVAKTEGRYHSLSPPTEINLNAMDVVWLRQDPPFDMTYITATHLLERLDPATLVFNNPFWVRNCPEKLAVLDHTDLIPPTMIAHDRAAIDSFRAAHRDIVIKPLYGNGGEGIFRLGPDDQNYSALLELVLVEDGLPMIVQKFIPAIVEGDKRILLIDGQPIGAINRLPPSDGVRANLHAGGRAVPAELTERDIAICERIGTDLHEKGLIFTGIDVIGGFLTEINITSPTGIVELEAFTGINAAEALWIEIETRHAQLTPGG